MRKKGKKEDSLSFLDTVLLALAADAAALVEHAAKLEAKMNILLQIRNLSS